MAPSSLERDLSKQRFCWATVLTAACLMAAACSQGDTFFVGHRNADLPVTVRGNVSSGVFVVMVAGGPGDTGLAAGQFPIYEQLEKRYGFVYWDQRSAGLAAGNPSPESLTLADLEGDLRAVIAAVRARYDVRSLFVHAHSWGGEVGTAYMFDHGDEVDGFINVDGVHDWQKKWNFGLYALRDAATAKAAQGEDPEKWTSVAAWAESKVDAQLSIEDEQTYFQAWGPIGFDPDLQAIVDKAIGDVTSDWGFLLFSPFSVASYLYTNRVNPLLDKINTDPAFFESLNQTDKLGAIRTPTLILWGRKDGQVLLSMGQDAYDHLATADADKKLVIFDGAAHHPMVQVPDAYAAEIIDFIDAHKRSEFTTSELRSEVKPLPDMDDPFAVR